MAFEGLSEKLNNVFKKLKSRGKLTESDVKEAMREVRLALLEADVSYKVVKEFQHSLINSLPHNLITPNLITSDYAQRTRRRYISVR